jgi:hypothetical protein
MCGMCPKADSQLQELSNEAKNIQNNQDLAVICLKHA